MEVDHELLKLQMDRIVQYDVRCDVTLFFNVLAYPLLPSCRRLYVWDTITNRKMIHGIQIRFYCIGISVHWVKPYKYPDEDLEYPTVEPKDYSE